MTLASRIWDLRSKLTKWDYVFFVLFIPVAFFPDIGNRPFYQSSAGLLLLTLYLAKNLYHKYGIEVGLGYALLVGSFFCEWSLPPVAYSDPQMWGGFGVQSACEAAVLSLTTFGAILAIGTKDLFQKILKALLFFAIADSFIVIVRGLLYGTYSAYFMLGNSAIDASFLACFLPGSGWFSIPILIAIGITKSSTGFGAVGIFVIAWLISKFGFKRISPLLAAIPLVMWGIGHFFLKDELFNSNGRFWVWKISFDLWTKPPSLPKIIGTGTGSFFIYGPTIMQRQDPGTHQTFFWMHNDWLQVLFENGILGFTIMALLFMEILYKVKNDANKFSMVCVYGFIALTQMPMHQFMLQILGLCFIGLFMNKLEDSKNSPSHGSSSS